MPWNDKLTDGDRRLLRAAGLRRVLVAPEDVELAIATAKFTSGTPTLTLSEIASDQNILTQHVQTKLQHARTMRLLADDNANWHGVMMQIWSGFSLEIKQNLPAPTRSATLESYVTCLEWIKPLLLALATKKTIRKARKESKSTGKPNEQGRSSYTSNRQSDHRVLNNLRLLSYHPEYNQNNIRVFYHPQYNPNNPQGHEQHSNRSGEHGEHRGQPYSGEPSHMKDGNGDHRDSGIHKDQQRHDEPYESDCESDDESDCESEPESECKSDHGVDYRSYQEIEHRSYQEIKSQSDRKIEFSSNQQLEYRSNQENQYQSTQELEYRSNQEAEYQPDYQSDYQPEYQFDHEPEYDGGYDNGGSDDGGYDDNGGYDDGDYGYD
ncbi:hypothetical protein F4818DRAFT_224263 [Hypoxylon cercidicola]|nr:hypothetical protein F4818DRAFT_224263 [Hypoxylon cercidicola]